MELTDSNSNWMVAHVGARDGYLAARSLAARGMLGSLVTDYWNTGVFAQVTKIAARRAVRRYDPRVPAHLVENFNWRTAIGEFLDSRAPRGATFDAWCRTGRAFGRRAAGVLLRRADQSTGVIGYTCGSLEIIRAAKKLGLPAVHNQIDPGFAYYEEKKREWELHPEAEEPPIEMTSEFRDRVSAEWGSADFIVVNSEYSRRSLHASGVPSEKIKMVPLATSTMRGAQVKKRERRGCLCVLWVGNVSLVKGFHYFAEAARALCGPRFRFIAAGLCHLKPSYMASLDGVVDFVGHLRRGDLNRYYEDSDVLVFPTLSDGFGAVQLEAMAFGLPVIATRNCGEVVHDGRNGFIVETRSGLAIAEALSALAVSEPLLESMSENALATSRRFDDAAYADHLSAVLREAERIHGH